MSEKTKKPSFADLKKALDKKYNFGEMLHDYDVISTGSLGLDLATGIGGFPRGRLIEMFSLESAGKTTVAQIVCANAMEKGLNVAYIDAEHAIDSKYAKTLGFDIESDQCILRQPDTVEDACNLAIDLAESGDVAVIVIDSLSALCPKKELEGDVGDNTIGLKARLLNQFLRKIKGIIKRNNVLLLTIGQLRDTIGGFSMGDTSTTDYGNGVKFTASMRIRYWKGIEKNSSGEPYANRTTAKILKNKCAAPFGKAVFDIIFGEGIDKTKELILLATELKIITKSGSWYSYGDVRLGQGSNGVKAILLDNPEMKEEIETKVYEHYHLLSESTSGEESEVSELSSMDSSVDYN